MAEKKPRGLIFALRLRGREYNDRKSQNIVTDFLAPKSV